MAPPVNVLVKAESEDSTSFEWRGELRRDQCLLVIAEAWAEAHGVPGSAVGFDVLSSATGDQPGTELSLTSTPQQLGWGREVVLSAYPKEDRYMELASTPEVPTATAATAPKVAPAGTAALDSAVSSTGVAQQREDKATRSSGATKPREDKEVTPAKATPAAVKAVATPAAAAAPATAKAQPTPAKAAGTPATAEPTPAKAAATPAKAEATPAKAATPKAPHTPGVGDPPTDMDEIVFDQENPKRQGTQAYERYQRYKSATTVAEALSRGAVKGDISNDFKKGFLKRKRS